MSEYTDIVPGETDFPATVDIVDVEPEAVQITADELRAGDYLFDSMGGRHRIATIARSNWITTIREDGWVDHWTKDETVTVIKGEA